MSAAEIEDLTARALREESGAGEALESACAARALGLVRSTFRELVAREVRA